MPATEGKLLPTRQLPGGKKWTLHESRTKYEADGGEFDILLHPDGFVVLVSFIHEPKPDDDCEFWRGRFETIEEAMHQAERM